MKILVIAPTIPTPWHITSYTTQWSHFLVGAFLDAGVEVILHKRYQSGEDIDGYISSVLDRAGNADAILALGVRYWTAIPREIGETLRKRFKGWVAQVHDGTMLDSAPCDVTFTVRDDAWKFKGNPGRLRRHNAYNVHVGWAGHYRLFYPEPSDSSPLRIFIDHAAFDCSGVDHSLTVQMNLKHLDRPYIARTLTDEGLVTVDPDNIVVKPYHRTPVPATDFAEELRKADVFFVTHRESLGLSVLEAAMCGAFICAPENAIAPDRLKTVNHYIYPSRIDWNQVCKGVNRTANAKKVSDCTWDNVAARILKKLKDRK